VNTRSLVVSSINGPTIAPAAAGAAAVDA